MVWCHQCPSLIFKSHHLIYLSVDLFSITVYLFSSSPTSSHSVETYFRFFHFWRSSTTLCYFLLLFRDLRMSHIFFARCLWVHRLSTCLSQCRSANVSSVIGRSRDRSPHHLFIQPLVLIWRTLRNTGRLYVLQFAVLNPVIQDEQIGSRMTDTCCNKILCRPTRIQATKPV